MKYSIVQFGFSSKIKTTSAMSMWKCVFLLFLTLSFSLLTFHLRAQGVTQYGQSAATSSFFVDKNGKIRNTARLNKYGQIVGFDPFTCGNTLTINHSTVGGVAPVDKTVNYGTVSTNLTGVNQCWITQNLGATNQAASVTDATEDASGWYWQFNRKQGYKHDGTTRTPNTAWIASISEPSDWVSANDPCKLELGATWRVPTNSEWTTADAHGGWNNSGNAYNSVLKLHLAGCLASGNGVLDSRGIYGYLWSSTQSSNNPQGNFLLFYSVCLMTSADKSYGFPLRCIKEIDPPATANDPFTCGGTLAVSHSASGGVAPVDKTVYYGTVSTTLSGASKCWITQNLGSTNQATSVTDATESAGGWYWQFNRKQGYKYDGARNPNTGWITSISEASDWIPANDPCKLELGATWRIPTNTEWTTADASGGWNNPDDAYNSVLKLHSAGYLATVDGSKYYVGSYGYYWSSTRTDNSNAYFLLLYTGSCDTRGNTKTYAFPLRCIKDCDPPTTANAGPDINPAYGATTATLAGNVPTVGTGTWSVVSGTATITTPGSPTSGVTGLAITGTATLRWTISNPPCAASYDDVVINTAASWSCGGLLTINHVAGSVAPVNKTVNYGTVTTSLSGASKCWITQNLGATNQATSVTDATEAASGWYWQFNRKKGYKYEGTTRTPNSAWIASISEASDWLPANDPCTLELGATWRIPTKSEWTTADAGWTKPSDAYNSVLKIHETGYLLAGNGEQGYLGSFGFYWSSTQLDASDGNFLFFMDGYSLMQDGLKSYGMPLRCIKDCDPPTTANAGADINLTCGASTATLAGNTPTVGIGTWSVISGTATITTPGSPTSGVTGLAVPGTAVLRWTISNPPCTASTDDVVITTSGWACGCPLTINHIAGTVAPVNKTVNYGTVTTALSGSSKCWITQNLGSTNQAISVADVTEAAQGWYWQFNRKQGYKYEASTRTPNTSWISSISEASDWLPANDPCTLELGATWRIPTKTEWTNADATANWKNPNDAYNSVLKLHSAGYLIAGSGAQDYLGSFGYYWSSTRSDASNGWFLLFLDGYCLMNDNSKPYGFPLRCLKD